MTLHDARTFNLPRTAGTWPAQRLVEARAVIANVARHSDHLVRLACNVLVTHGKSDTERRDARALLFVIDARRPMRQRHVERSEREAGQ
ncbi:hypothetical protein [Pararhizobium antarcticum]|uniref:Uncharacterized protein n=1 Tax=Pararhizobium antarcticum TaxID=1798805 RepID=A0A657LLZ5_9HYPH|nr:hypothetical protein [Pararhizobium antarcticum]OJF90656.1 hypothetical protein AX760_24210 [Pararhizobium antarcticum]